MQQQQRAKSASSSMNAEGTQVGPLKATLLIANNLAAQLTLVNAVLEQGEWDNNAKPPAQIEPGATGTIIATAPLTAESGIVGDVLYKTESDGVPIVFAFRVPFGKPFPNQASIAQLPPSNLLLSVTPVEPFDSQIRPVYSVSPE